MANLISENFSYAPCTNITKVFLFIYFVQFTLTVFSNKKGARQNSPTSKKRTFFLCLSNKCANFQQKFSATLSSNFK